MRDLFEKIFEFKGKDLSGKVIFPWIREHDYKEYLSSIADKIPNKSCDPALYELYAFSRVLDVLTLRFQPNNRAGGPWPGPKITLIEYITILEILELDVTTPSTFNPFNCEILEARPGKSNFEIIECMFPAIKLKNTIIKRAGVVISLNPLDYDLTLVNNAIIYWTYWRKNRKHEDLSHGWGSNSQWATDFRLDIETEDTIIYNYFGKYDLNNPTSGVMKELEIFRLDLTEAIELVKYRHFITSKNDKILFPYDFRYEDSIKNDGSLKRDLAT